MHTAEIVITSESLADTEAFAERIGRRLRGKEIIELIGDVGAGKTSFVRGLVRGIGSVDRVSSPTFTVSQVYGSGNVTIHHYDFYRIDDTTIMQAELAEVMQDPSAVVVLEWAGAVENTLPAERVSIRMEPTSETGRQFTCTVPESYAYLELEA